MKHALLIISTFLALNMKASTLKVCSNCAFQSIPEAFDQAVDGDTLLILNGHHKLDNIDINKSIVLLGKENPVIQSLKGEEIITVTAPGVVITGITFEGVQPSYLKEHAAIRIKGTKDFKITNNTFNDCFFSIYIEKGRNGIIEDNNMMGNSVREADSGNGVHAWYSKNLTIKNNNISGHRDGIYFEFVDDSHISGNLSKHNLRYGLHFMFSNDDEYYHNTFESNGVGVAVMFSRRIEMKHNTFIRNWGTAAYGLLLKEIFDANIQHNVFQENTVGIFVEGSNRIIYSENDFLQNGWAIKFSGGCEANEIVRNNFLHNSLDMLVSSKLYENVVNENYWSNYSGYDLDKNGLGDVPYYPVKLYSYMLNQVPESVVLLRSLFVDLINFAEKISPVFTPKDVFDASPKMSRIE